jgi:tripartite-type tricarboxylate transporter receptor subunit TctC
MTLPRRTFLQFTGAAITASASSKVARAQTYPTRPITMIVPFAAGSVTDTIGRVVAERMRASLRQPITSLRTLVGRTVAWAPTGP